ncbi:hypothetical protein MJG53_003764 [Ovis ammon polii x Ovis aries]|uniref:Uncharacterized protein n=1 Tax=Ovis ammon polii x Ovis aries TaxID=2918886 RepID=A0ACB9VIS3_9CETA|nr:hypothetical protein MJG53_003764 [Ovis ammon polii x Ovis aries]
MTGGPRASLAEPGSALLAWTEVRTRGTSSCSSVGVCCGSVSKLSPARPPFLRRDPRLRVLSSPPELLQVPWSPDAPTQVTPSQFLRGPRVGDSQHGEPTLLTSHTRLPGMAVTQGHLCGLLAASAVPGQDWGGHPHVFPELSPPRSFTLLALHPPSTLLSGVTRGEVWGELNVGTGLKLQQGPG